MSGKAPQDKQGNPIREGDFVSTKIRGGVHEGHVEKIVMTEHEAEDENVKNPPKVLFHDQKGKWVAHNPSTLTKEEEGYEEGYDYDEEPVE